MYTKDSTKTYTFGAISFTVRNYLGVYFLSDKIKAEIKALSVEEATKVNKEAWRQYNTKTWIANRHNNVSISGNMRIYEEASSHADVAKQITRETWKRMQGY